MFSYRLNGFIKTFSDAHEPFTNEFSQLERTTRYLFLHLWPRQDMIHSFRQHFTRSLCSSHFFIKAQGRYLQYICIKIWIGALFNWMHELRSRWPFTRKKTIVTMYLLMENELLRVKGAGNHASNFWTKIFITLEPIAGRMWKSAEWWSTIKVATYYTQRV